MGIEEEIATLLLQGATPRELVPRYSKSTVYKVHDTLRARQAPVPQPQILVTPHPEWGRYQPGATATLNLVATNQGSADFYVFQTGVRPEWLAFDQWLPSTHRRLLAPGASLALRFVVPIPPDCPFGVHDLFFGIQGQWVGPQVAGAPAGIMWTNPFLLRVQVPLSGDTVFLAHSVSTTAPVSQLEATLDDYGMASRVSTDAATDVDIAAASFFVAVVTDLAHIGTVLNEIQIARRHGKEPILLRDQLVAAAMHGLSDESWIDVAGLAGGMAGAIPLVFQALQELGSKRALQKAARRQENVERLLLAVGAAAVAIAIAKGTRPE